MSSSIHRGITDQPNDLSHSILEINLGKMKERKRPYYQLAILFAFGDNRFLLFLHFVCVCMYRRSRRIMYANSENRMDPLPLGLK